MPQIIPNIYKQIYVEDVLIELEDKYADIGPIWVKNQMEWNNNIYSSFKDHDKYMIIIYLIKKTLDFYSKVRYFVPKCKCFLDVLCRARKYRK